MKHYILQTIQQDSGILYLTLSPKNHGRGLRFQPGQYVTIGFRGTHGRLSPMRCFSITSSADSNDLQLAARLGGDFTQALADLSVGDEMYVQGPFGDFVIDTQHDSNVVMIACGIGITPFMSMLRTSATAASPPMTLLYSCRTGHGIPFHDELREMERTSSKLRVVVFATDQTNSPEIPRMFSGRMTDKHINQVTNDGYYARSTYFICGPKGFTENTEAMLLARGVAADRIMTESFTQASKVTLGGYNLRKVTYTFAAALLLVGVVGIAFLDLSRYVPGHTVSAASTRQSSQTLPATSATTSTPTTTTSTTTQSTGSSTASSSADSSSTSSDNTYQQPVTSVS